MLEHLLDYEPPICVADNFGTLPDKAAPDALLDAQVSTADWLENMGAPAAGEAERLAAQSAAQAAFAAIQQDKPAP